MHCMWVQYASQHCRCDIVRIIKRVMFFFYFIRSWYIYSGYVSRPHNTSLMQTYQIYYYIKLYYTVRSVNFSRPKWYGQNSSSLDIAFEF